jgi:Carbohydrate binding domain (family 11)
LSGYQGLRLWVRSGATSAVAAKQVRLNLRTPGTVMGGTCTACSDHFGVEIPLTSKWTQVDVPFATLKQMGYGRPMLASADLTRALGIELLFPVNVSFDLWLDDVELY